MFGMIFLRQNQHGIFVNLFCDKIFNLAFSIGASVVIGFANLCIYSTKVTALAIAYGLIGAFITVALCFAIITAGVKSIFCMSRIADLLESFSHFVSNKLTNFVDFLSKCFTPNDAPIPVAAPKLNPLQELDKTCNTVTYLLKALALTVHCASEAGVVLNATPDMGSSRQTILALGKSMYSFFTSLKPIFFASEDHKKSSAMDDNSTPHPNR